MKIPILKLALEQGHTIETREDYEDYESYFHSCPEGDACETCPFGGLNSYDNEECLLTDRDKLSQEAVDYVKQHHPELLI
jgi:hypothetical protein